MHIPIVSGTGTATTELAAFDAALIEAGTHNYNLLCLSSVIPPAAQVAETGTWENPTGVWGDRLYCVMAHYETSQHNEEAWAAVGWVQNEETGQGLFVEHEGTSEDQVSKDIHDSLADLVRNRPEVSFGEPQMVIRGVRCEDHPVSALVIAIYETAPWETAVAGAPVLP